MKEKLDISSTWEKLLPQYLELYSRLNDEGKQEMKQQVQMLGAVVDRIQKIKGGTNNANGK